MTMRKILEIATQIIGVYLILTAIPALLSGLIVGCAMSGNMESLNLAQFISAGVAGPFIKLCIGLWAALAAKSISRTFRPNDD